MNRREANAELLNERLQARANALLGEVQGEPIITFQPIGQRILWVAEYEVELQIDTEDGEVYETRDASFDGWMDDDPADHLAEVWDAVMAEYAVRMKVAA